MDPLFRVIAGRCCDFYPDGSALAIGFVDGNFSIVDAESMIQLISINQGNKIISTIKFSQSMKVNRRVRRNSFIVFTMTTVTTTKTTPVVPHLATAFMLDRGVEYARHMPDIFLNMLEYARLLSRL